jgi:hypothetical protein
MLRTADADVLPMRFADLADTAARYVAEVQRLADSEREDAKKLKVLLDAGAFKLAGDPQVTYGWRPGPRARCPGSISGSSRTPSPA